MNQIESILVEIILNPVVSSGILIAISICALISIKLMFQGIKNLMTCSTNKALSLKKKDSVMHTILVVGITYISKCLTVKGYESHILQAIVIVSFIALVGIIVSHTIYLTGKLSNKLVERKK